MSERCIEIHMRIGQACRWCGGVLAVAQNLVGARRCLSCGKGTTPDEIYVESVPKGEQCGETLACGGSCIARRDTPHEHVCGADELDKDGHSVPGTCPA